MNTKHYQILRWGIIALGLGYSIAGIFLLVPAAENGVISNFGAVAIAVRSVFLLAVGLVICFKLRTPNVHIFFGLFLVNFGYNGFLAFIQQPWWLNTGSWALTGASFIYALILYPGRSAHEMYREYYDRKRAPKWYKRSVLFLTDTKHFWYIFFPALLAIRTASIFISPIIMQSLNLVVMIAGFIYFRVSYLLTHRTDRRRLGWVLWGIIVSFVLMLADVLVRVFFPDAPEMYYQISITLISATTCCSLTMAVFFVGFLDTGVIVKRTIVYSTIFLVVLFLFTVVEHFAIHGLSVMLKVENEMLNSFFAGFIALLVEPLHKRLEHVIPKI